MSLTSHLHDAEDPVTCFIRKRFPNNRPIGRQFLSALEGAKVLESPGRVSGGTIGTAFDWRVRFMFKQPPDLHLAQLGALFYWHKPKEVIDLSDPREAIAPWVAGGSSLQRRCVVGFGRVPVPFYATNGAPPRWSFHRRHEYGEWSKY